MQCIEHQGGHGVQKATTSAVVTAPTTSDVDGSFTISDSYITQIDTAFQQNDASAARALIAPLHAADQAELFDRVSPDARHWLTETLSASDSFDAEILPDLSADAAEDVVEALGNERTAEALSDLETDDAIHVIEDLDLTDQHEILEGLPTDLRQEVEEGLTYPEESAGRLMRKHLVAIADDWSVGDTIDFLRAEAELPERFYVIYVVNQANQVQGRVLLGTLLQQNRDTKITDIVSDDNYTISTNTDQEEVAYLFRKYALVEAPVVDESSALVGTITVDDVVDVIQEEEEEDYLRAGGVIEQDFGARLFETARARFSWLFINMLTAILASMVIGLFAHTLEQIVLLAIMMPIVASMGGNTGTQSVTVSVRAIAVKYLSEQNRRSYIKKETLIGLINGVLLGLIMGVGVYAVFADALMGLVMMLAAIVTMTIAGAFGALIPIMLHKRGIDPAISSSILLTTITDSIGFFSFLGLATLILL
jgi:magnesium transporter